MTKKNRKKQNNAGMSLVEIVVVVLIIGILSSAAVLGFSFINSMDAESAAEGIMSTLERTKLDTLASNNSDTIQMKLCKEGNHYYGIVLNGTEELDKVEIGKNGVSITVNWTDGGTLKSNKIEEGSDADWQYIKYKKSNGSFDCDVKSIVVEGTDTVTVRLVNATGRSYPEYAR